MAFNGYHDARHRRQAVSDLNLVRSTLRRHNRLSRKLVGAVLRLTAARKFNFSELLRWGLSRA